MTSEPGADPVEVRPSPIQGLGVFATRDYVPGELVRRMVIVREITERAPLRQDRGERFEHQAYPDGKVLLVGYPDRHTNHSCDPNLYEVTDDGARDLCARRPLAKGEELTLDYTMNTAGGQSWPCHCGAARCRGETVGDFFHLPPGIQCEYLPYLAHWFVRHHRDRVEAIRRRCEADSDGSPGV